MVNFAHTRLSIISSKISRKLFTSLIAQIVKEFWFLTKFQLNFLIFFSTKTREWSTPSQFLSKIFQSLSSTRSASRRDFRCSLVTIPSSIEFTKRLRRKENCWAHQEKDWNWVWNSEKVSNRIYCIYPHTTWIRRENFYTQHKKRPTHTRSEIICISDCRLKWSLIWELRLWWFPKHWSWSLPTKDI